MKFRRSTVKAAYFRSRGRRHSDYPAGRTRIHLGRVEGLGDFLEPEVVLSYGERAEAGGAIARGTIP